MAPSETDRLLDMLRDPHTESRDVAAAAGVPREEAARAARLVLAIEKAAPEEVSPQGAPTDERGSAASADLAPQGAPSAERGSAASADLATLPAPLALALCRAALSASRPDLLAALAGHPGKEVTKEAKRALHVLKSRGVAVPEPPRPAAPPPATIPEPPSPAYATAVDARGERAVWIPRAVPGKGVEVAQAVLSDELGIVELQLGVVGRKEWRAIAKGLLERGAAMGLHELDRRRASSLVAAARSLNDRSGRPVPERADLWLAQAGPTEPPPDPAASFPPLPAEEEDDALAASGKLHDLALLQPWLAEEGFLREVVAKLDEIAVSPLYVDERQRAAQMAHVVSDAVERYFDEGRRAALSRRLFSIAEHLLARGDPAHAHAAAAAARALRAGVAPRAIPFARLLVEKAFPAVTSPPDDRSAGPPGDEGSPLIVAPR